MTSDPATPRAWSRYAAIRLVRDLVIMLVVAVVAAVLVQAFLVRAFYIPSPSMEPTLQGDSGHPDRILVNELVPALVSVQRGDVVVFKDPGGWLEGEAPTQRSVASPLEDLWSWARSLVGFSDPHEDGFLVKRVIGLPGDRVTCCTALGQVSVNGVPLDEPYTQMPQGTAMESPDPFNIVVPSGELWVMGDNRWNSRDSRYHQNSPTRGGVPIKDVVGRAVVISWPLSRWRALSSYPDTFVGIPAPAR